jgi:hypothetical protein
MRIVDVGVRLYENIANLRDLFLLVDVSPQLRVLFVGLLVLL